MRDCVFFFKFAMISCKDIRNNMKQPTKTTDIISFLLFMLMTTLILAACNGGKPKGKNIADTVYPEPNPEEVAAMKLFDVLHSSEGKNMTGAQLAVLKDTANDEEHLFCINLPVTDIDERPVADVAYTNKETGGTLLFHYGPGLDDESIDSVGAIGTVDIRTVIHSWESADCLPDSANTRSVEARGNSIYTPYHTLYYESYEINDQTYPACWAPEYYGCLIYVYPGADSLLVTWGYEESKRVYRR